MELLAKGAFNPKRGFGVSLEPFSLSEIIFYQREGRERALISEATLLFDFRRFREEIRLFHLASSLAEFIVQTLPKEVAQNNLYRLFLSTLFLLDQSKRESIFYSFFLKAASLLGYQPNLSTCLQCQKRLKALFFAPKRGGFLCEVCQKGKVIQFSEQEKEKLKNLLLLPQRDIVEVELSKKEKEAIREFLASHLNFFPPP